MKNSFFVSPFTFALLLAVILMVGSTVFASERDPAMARRPSDSAEGQGEFRRLRKELERDYQALFKTLEESAPKIAEAALPAADQRLSMAAGR